MRPISGLVLAALAVLVLASCSTSSGSNTTYARPENSGSGVSIPLN